MIAHNSVIIEPEKCKYWMRIDAIRDRDDYIGKCIDID